MRPGLGQLGVCIVNTLPRFFHWASEFVPQGLKIERWTPGEEKEKPQQETGKD